MKDVASIYDTAKAITLKRLKSTHHLAFSMLIIENTSLQINYQSTKKLGFQNFIHIVHKDATRRNSKIPTQKMESIRVAVKNPKEASNVVELFGTGMLQQDSKRLLIKFS